MLRSHYSSTASTRARPNSRILIAKTSAFLALTYAHHAQILARIGRRLNAGFALLDAQPVLQRDVYTDTALEA